MSFRIEDFASSLCLGFATGMSDRNPKLSIFGHTGNPLDVYNVISKLLQKYDPVYDVCDKLSNAKTYSDPSLLMKAIMSRCLRLSDTPNYFNFMLICTVINTTIHLNFKEFKCYTFAKVASISLLAVYNRKYKNLFDTNEETLSGYCESLRKVLTSANENEIKLPTTREIDRLLLKLVDKFDMDFVLEKYEEIELKHALDVSKRDFESMLSDNKTNLSQEDLSAASQICKYCGFECYRIFLSYEAQVNKKA